MCALVQTRSQAQDGQLDKALQTAENEQRSAAAAQQKVAALSDQSGDLLRELRATQQRTQSIRQYNDQLSVLVEAQQGQIVDLQKQLEEVTVVGRDIVPLMLRMLEALDELVRIDMPFLLDERRERVANLHKLMDDPDASTAEKYRRIMEAYQIELDYSRTIEVYRGQLGEGADRRTVDFLRFGRVALLYNSLDRREAGTWNKQTRQFDLLGEQYIRAMPRAIRIAREQTAPDLILLPLPAPEEAAQ